MFDSLSDENVCYVEMKNLDGEINLKIKCLVDVVDLKFDRETFAKMFEGKTFIECEYLNNFLYMYFGNLFIGVLLYLNGKKVLFNFLNMLLWGLSFCNTEWIVGVCVYIGYDLKVMMNVMDILFKCLYFEK